MRWDALAELLGMLVVSCVGGFALAQFVLWVERRVGGRR